MKHRWCCADIISPKISTQVSLHDLSENAILAVEPAMA